MESGSLNLPDGPAWSLALGTVGQALIFLAAACSIATAVLSVLGKSPRIARGLFFTTGLCFFAAISVLGTLFVTDQFHFRYIFSHSDAGTELRYKVSAIWSGQEGSFLLWAVCSSVFGLLAVSKTGAYQRFFLIPFALFLASLAGILAYESPFDVTMVEGRPMLPPTGLGLAPSLLNYWVTIHPPTIFLGFGSLAVPFCWAIAALISGDLDSWLPKVRPWAIVSASILGLGLCMGGFWAYETLGWGGFWAWDPVENVSFVPWCLMIAFIHGAFIQAAKRGWAMTNAILAGTPFILFVYGTFLTRSGLLGDTSVHSFAQMERTALKLLVGLMFASVIGFVSVAIWRARQAKAVQSEQQPSLPMNKRFAYTVGIWLLCALAVATGFGMSVPLVMTLTGQAAKVVEPKLYHQVLAWLIVPLLLLMGAAPFLTWRGKPLREVLGGLSNVLAIAVGLLGFTLIWIKRTVYSGSVAPADSVPLPLGYRMDLLTWMGILLGLCIWVVVASFWQIVANWRKSRSSAGALMAHIGVAVTLAGLFASLGFEKKAQTSVREGRSGQGLDNTFLYAGTTSTFDDRNNKVKLTVSGPKSTFVARPGLYLITDRDGNPQPFLWPHVERRGFYDTYITLGQPTLEATAPTKVPKGATRMIEDENVLVTYEGFERVGEPGMLGTKFVANLTIKSIEGSKKVKPAIEITGEGMKSHDADIGDDLQASLIGVDPADGSANIQFKYTSPLFPIEVYYKPGTIFVWAGAGIMTLGGLLAAYSRSRAARSASPDVP